MRRRSYHYNIYYQTKYREERYNSKPLPWWRAFALADNLRANGFKDVRLVEVEI